MTTYVIASSDGKISYSFSAATDAAAAFIGQLAASTNGQLFTQSIPAPTPLPNPYPPNWQLPPPQPSVPQWWPQSIPQSPWQTLITQMQATNVSGVAASERATYVAALQAAGSAFDSGANTGARNANVYALQYQAWAVLTAGPAWNELDRVARYLATAIGLTVNTGNPTQDAAATKSNLAAFGLTTVSAPAPLPFDPMLQTLSTLTGRYTVAASIATSTAPLLSLLTQANSGWTAALAAMTTPNSSADGASIALANALATATANANGWLAAASFK